jgi:hypothetical protein
LGQTKVPTPGGRAAGTSTTDLNTPPNKKKNTKTPAATGAGHPTLLGRALSPWMLSTILQFLLLAPHRASAPPHFSLWAKSPD